MRSIRAKLVVGLVSAVLGVSLVAGTVLALVVRHRVTRDFDAALAGKARAMSAMVKRDRAGKVDVDFEEEILTEFAARRLPEYFEVRDAAAVAERSPSLNGSNWSTGTEPGARAVTLPDGRPGRELVMRFVPEAKDEEDGVDRPPGPAATRAVTLAVARGTEPIRETMEVLGWGLGFAGVVMAAGAAAAVWAMVGRGLRPLRGVAEQAARIDAGTLSARFGSDVPTELGPIVTRLNELLARLEAAFARERRFTAAAAHELRTPIAELRAMAEVAIRWPGEAPQQGMSDVLAVARNMEALAASLLALSRCESGQEQAAREPVDLAASVGRAWEAVARRAAERGITLDVRTDGNVATALADPAMLDAVARNLLDNAVEYAPSGTRIACQVGDGRLAVTNAQEGLSDADVASVFEPFWRRDKARTGGTHAGLGLSLVKAYAAAMGAQARAALTADRQFRIELIFAHPPTDAVTLPSSSNASIAADDRRGNGAFTCDTAR